MGAVSRLALSRPLSLHLSPSSGKSHALHHGGARGGLARHGREHARSSIPPSWTPSWRPSSLASVCTHATPPLRQPAETPRSVHTGHTAKRGPHRCVQSKPQRRYTHQYLPPQHPAHPVGATDPGFTPHPETVQGRRGAHADGGADHAFPQQTKARGPTWNAMVSSQLRKAEGGHLLTCGMHTLTVDERGWGRDG